MARVTGPLFSLGASGKLGGALVYAGWKGRPYVRELVIPSNPKSEKQLSVRAMMKFLSQQWANLTTVEQATWEAKATQEAVSPFNAFTQVNMKRWATFAAPGQVDPVTEGGTVDGMTVTTATGGVRQATIEITTGAPLNEQWGCMVFRSTSMGFATSFDNLVQVVLTDIASTAFTWVDTPLDPGTYYYNYRTFTDDGLLAAEVGEDSAIVA